ncbi:Envoplakin 210 kDa cornified envelope precursor protein [Takifugu flavidus]|uniref:Envoplakin 210 kDa cornified envelope protein n=1 Tax=Takifugu flavidus TaxID=433684 RepID=A0A5C6NQ65_9TELE|nr:Envoplakin 210 kDa cornified envelope precursor protein [Takifugu flavidus]
MSKEQSPVKISRTQANELALLISRMQLNADQVEKNILQSEERLALDAERDDKNLPLMHQKVNADSLVEAEVLLKELFMDVDKAKKLQHPQATEIERDVKNLHERWAKDCGTFRELYNQLPDLELKQKIDWGPLLDEKQKQLDVEPFGPNLADVEKQIAAHNILHQAIQSYSAQLTPDSITSQVLVYINTTDGFGSDIVQVALYLRQESSQQRRSNLASLYEYMQSCSKELVYLSGQQERILQRDWSDLMSDPPSVRMEYEKFKNNGLLAHESEVNKLQDEGDRLVEIIKHPGSPAITVHRNAMQNEWQAFLNLCLAQETHLDNIEDYKKFQLDSDMLSDSLTRLKANMDPKSLNTKSNSEVLLELEGDEPAMKRNEQRLSALKELGSRIPPLKQRRIHPTKLTTAVSLCDWVDGEEMVRRGERLTLKSNADSKNWELETLSGVVKTLPGACFMIPPPDVEALDKVASLDREFRELQNNRSKLLVSLKNPTTEVLHVKRTVPVQSVPEDPKATELSREIDDINKTLDQCNIKILSQLRVPLDNQNPVQDLERRLQEYEKSARTIKRLDSEMSSIQRDVGPVLAKNPSGPITSSLLPKMRATNDKIDDINNLINLSNKKVSASMFLEKQIHKVDSIVSGFEEQLAKDGVIHDKPNTLQTCNQQLQKIVMDIKKKSSDLDRVKGLSRDLQNILNEYEVKSNTYQSTLNEDEDGEDDDDDDDDYEPIPRKFKSLTLTQAVQQKEKDLLNLYSEVSGENDQLLSQLEIAKDIKARNEDTIHHVVISQQLQLQSQKKDQEASESLKNELSEEISRRIHAEKDLETYRRRLVSLKNRRGVERTEEKEVVHYYRDPKLEMELQSLKNRIKDDAVKRSKAHGEIDIYKEKVVLLEKQLQKIEPKLVTKDLTTLKLRYGELERLKPKVEVKEIINEIYRVDPETEVELKPKVEYKEVNREVIKEEKSPEVIRELQRLNNQVSRLQLNCETTLELLTRLRKERDQLKAEKSKVETNVVTREVIKYENDPLLEKEADRLRRNVREEIQHRRSLEECLFELQNQYILLERQKPEEKVITQEVVRLQKDPKQMLEHEKLNKNLDDETKSRRKLELEVRQFRALIQEKEAALAQMDDHQRKIQVESELRQLKSHIHELENAPPPVEEKIVIEEVLKVERDPKLEKLTDDLRANVEVEATNIARLEREIRNLKVKLEILLKEKSVEKVVHREIVRVEKDPVVEAEREHLRELVSQERNHRRDQEDEVQNITIKISQIQSVKSMTSQEEAALITNRDALLREKEDLLKQIKILDGERLNISETFQQQSRRMSERKQMIRQKTLKASSEVQHLEKEILSQKEKIFQRDAIILELQNNIKKEDQSETHTRETNLSTKITIMDPETGKDMSPYEAYIQGLIDRNHYIQLSELECDWEEITSTGPDGDVTILQDRKSGKQYSVKDALREGRLSQYDMMRYKEGKLHISEFALLVAGETKQPYIPAVASPKSPNRSTSFSPLNSMHSSLRSSYTKLNSQQNVSNHSSLGPDDHFPISGVVDTTTHSRMSVRSAVTRKLIDPDTALKLLEAQAASGGIVDLTKKDKLSVHKAVGQGLIDQGQMYKLLNAQKAFTGVEDPSTKERLAVAQAAKKGYMSEENARRYLLAQYLTGGLVDPSRAGRLSIQEALDASLIDSTTASELQDESSYIKELVDPITEEKISYKQAIDRCKKDITTGLLLLPVASTDASNTPSYSNYQFSATFGHI